MDQVQSFDQATLEAMINNLKGITDAWNSSWQNADKQRQGLQDKLNDQYLRFVEDQHTLVMRTADSNARLMARQAENAATSDHLADLDALTPPAETAQAAIGAKVAEEVSSTAKDAIKTALGQTALTSAPSQGVTGVAQGAVQAQIPAELAQIILNANTVQTALLAELAKIEQALSTILTKVTGEAVKTA